MSPGEFPATNNEQLANELHFLWKFMFPQGTPVVNV